MHTYLFSWNEFGASITAEKAEIIMKGEKATISIRKIFPSLSFIPKMCLVCRERHLSKNLIMKSLRIRNPPITIKSKLLTSKIVERPNSPNQA